ncbi:MAG TPA: hypothetical protein VF103_18080 [Polyangiaceae bacterium]
MGPLTQWRGQSDTTLGRFGWGFLMSLLLHLPLTPLAALFGLLTLLTATKPPVENLPPLTGIPVDLLEGEEAETPPPATPPPPAPEPAVALEPPPEKPHHEPSEPKIRDAGVSDAEPSDAAADADAASEGADAGAEDGGITDPVAASGAERVADVNANVQILIFSEKIRAHPLAARVGRSLSSIYQWRDFFGPAALDPIADVDRMLIVGPQLRDSSEVAVVAKVNVSKERVHEAIDGLVRADPDSGAWLDGGVPEATARVDRAERHFIMPSPKIIIISPPSAAAKARKVGKRFTLPGPQGNEVATAKLATPWRAVRGTGIPLDIPKSILWARGKVTLDEHGSAVIEIVAKDESPEKAAEDAEYLERKITAVTQINLGLLGAVLGTGNHKLVEKVLFSSQGDEIHGAILVTQRQLAEILDFAMAFLSPGPARRSRRDAGASPGPTPTDVPERTPSEVPAPPPEPAPAPPQPPSE